MLSFKVGTRSFDSSLEAQDHAVLTGSKITVDGEKAKHPKLLSHKLPDNTLTLDQFQKASVAKDVQSQLYSIALPEKPECLSHLSDKDLYKFLCAAPTNPSLELAEYREKINSQKVEIVFNPTRRSTGDYKLSPLFAPQFCKKIKIDV